MFNFIVSATVSDAFSVQVCKHRSSFFLSWSLNVSDHTNHKSFSSPGPRYIMRDSSFIESKIRSNSPGHPDLFCLSDIIKKIKK